MRSDLVMMTVLAAALAMTACTGTANEDDTQPEAENGAGPTNRIDLPGSVRQNLGITWAKATHGRLEKIYAAPGEIIARPDASWALHAPLAGTVTRIAERWQAVKAGDVVAEIASPELAELQTRLHDERARAGEARIALRRARAGVEPAEELARTLTAAATGAKASVARAEDALTETRRASEAASAALAEVRRLRAKDSVSAATLLAAQREAAELQRDVNEAEQTLRAVRIEAAEQAVKAAEASAEAEESDRKLAILQTRLTAAESSFTQRLASLAALCGTTTEALSAEQDGVAHWARLTSLPLRAVAAGVVVEVDTARGSWLDRDESLLRILDPTRLAFRALVPEADVAGLPSALSMRLVGPGESEARARVTAHLRPVADAARRSVIVEAIIDDADGALRVGMSATGQVVIGGGEHEEVLVPLACVVRDGLESVVFRRDPADADKVIRTTVTLGMRSGGLVEVIAGVGAGEQLVRDGIHQLRQTGLGKGAGGGHFHADGTFHEDH